MEKLLMDVTSLSSKGQLVLSKNIRNYLSLVAGDKLMVFSDGENVLLKPIKDPDIKDFKYLLDQSNKWAKKVGMKQSDINEAKKEARKKCKAR